MKYYTPVTNIFSIPPKGEPVIPSFVAQRHRLDCPLCRQTVMIAVPTTFIDWEKVATVYQAYAQKLVAGYHKAGEELLEQYGTNPATEHFRMKIQALIDELNSGMNDAGESWKG